MKTRYGASPWILGVSDARRPAYPRFRGEDRADVVVVGGGLTGCATAYALAQSGVRTVVVDAHRLGQAGTGRSAGLLLPEPGPAFRAVTEMHGLRAARMAFETWRHAALDAAALLRRVRIRCALAPCDSILVASPEDERALRREYDARCAAGLELSWLGRPHVRKASGLEGGVALRMQRAFTVDPYRACLGLASAAARRGARIFERSRVRTVRSGSKEIEIVLDGGTLRAATVIVATGGATMEFKPLRRHFEPRERYLVMTEPVAAPVRRQVLPGTVALRDMRMPPHRIRWTPDHRLVVAGADQEETPAAGRDAVLTQRTGQLMYATLTLYPAITGLRPERGWEAPYSATPDGLMYIGAHRNYPRHLFALGGGDSATGSFLAARILARAVLGQPQKADEVFGWTR